jgi:hypothetical protein
MRSTNERVSLGNLACVRVSVAVVVTLKSIRHDLRLRRVLLGSSKRIILFAACEPEFCGYILKWEVDTPINLLMKYETLGGSPVAISYITIHI